MMTSDELSRLELLAEVDSLMADLDTWATRAPDWAIARQCQAIVRRLVERADTLRVRLDAPLVVATLGGTGTGKSTLVNALVGSSVAQSGRQRPTTRRPVLLAHSQADVEILDLPLDELEVVRCDADLLRDIVIIDCPDPDTTDTDASDSNLQRLRQMLPNVSILY